MPHVCPSVPMGSDCVVYVEPCECGHECGVDTDSGRRLRHEFAGSDSHKRAASHAHWIAKILGHFCRVGDIRVDICGEEE